MKTLAVTKELALSLETGGMLLDSLLERGGKGRMGYVILAVPLTSASAVSVASNLTREAVSNLLVALGSQQPRPPVHVATVIQTKS